jgi:phosphoglucomutase
MEGGTMSGTVSAKSLIGELKRTRPISPLAGKLAPKEMDPLGGAAKPYWEPIISRYGLNIDATNPGLDPTFSFMTVDHDGEIRMDCSSRYAMARLVNLKDRYRLAFANDRGADRHGIVTVAASGWFAARPSGTENVYKIYAQSFRDQPHLDALVHEPQQIVDNALL